HYCRALNFPYTTLFRSPDSDRQGEEILPRLRLLGEGDGGQNGGLAHGGEDGAVGLAGDAARFERQGLAGPVDGLAFDIEHFGSRSEEHTSELQSRENLV